MRIALFTESYRPVVNGVSVSVERLAEGLRERGHQPTIVAPRFAGYNDDDSSDTSVLRLRSWRTVFNPDNPFAYPPILPPAILRNQRFDIIHTHQPFGIGLQGRAFARRLQIPLVSTFHTLYQSNAHYVPFLPPFVVNTVVSRQLRSYYRTCNTVVVPSRAAADILQTLSPQCAVLIVPTGIPDALPVSEDELARARRRYDLPGDSPVLLYVGRLAREKNIALLIAAFAKLDSRRTNQKPPILLLVGGGPESDWCGREIHRLGLSDRVRRMGYLPPADLPPVYALADLFVFPSGGETQGLVIGEAQSHGLPCVLVRGGGSGEFVRDGVDAHIVPPEITPFADAIADLLLNNDRRNAFAAHALGNPLRPTPAAMTDKILAAYKEAIYARRTCA